MINIDIEKRLLLLTLDCLLSEKQRLAQWALNPDKHNQQALKNGLLQCIQHFQMITQHDLFNKLSANIKQAINQNSQDLSRIYAQIKDLPPAESENGNIQITYQIPSRTDLMAMNGLRAGAKDTQKQRIEKMTKTLRAHLNNSLLTETKSPITHHYINRLSWLVLCKAIRLNNKELAEAAFDAIPADNLLLQTLLKTHSKIYLLDLIKTCASLNENMVKQINPDVICNQLTFEILINDLITTLEQRQVINISFGLPTHHAYHDAPAGFCLINKVAAIMAYEQLTASSPFHAVIIGTDVNRDDGLNAILMGKNFTQSFTHIDIHDSRVYPWHKARSKTLQRNNQSYKRYQIFDLASHPRKSTKIHPALVFALDQLEMILAKSSESQQKIILFLPTGWDSHYKETAPCGKLINEETMLTPAESIKCRFTDNDFDYFNQQLIELHQRYQSSISRIYWQLEGGYTQSVSRKQIINLTTTMQAYADLSNTASMSYIAMP